MTNWPGLTEVTALPTSSTMPQYSCPIGVGCGTALMPRYGHRSDPHTHVAEILMMASVGLVIVGASRSSKRTSRGPYRIAPCMVYILVFLRGARPESVGPSVTLSRATACPNLSVLPAIEREDRALAQIAQGGVHPAWNAVVARRCTAS